MAEPPATGIPQWKGLFDWSIQFQDGTHPSNFSAEEFTPERRAWLEAAMKHYMKDFVDRMAEIKKALDQGPAGADAAALADPAAAPAPGHSLEERELLLDELMDLVSSIDYARDLHKIGGLPTLLDLLSCPQPTLRSRAAEVVATCMANNPPVQQWFLDGGVLAPLLSLLRSDPSAVVRNKALLALSALVRHSDTGLAAFKHAGGLPLLVASLSSFLADARMQRKAFALLQYMLAECPDDTEAACHIGVLPPLAAALLDAEGSTDVRQVVLSVLLELTSSPYGWHAVRDFTAPGSSSGAATTSGSDGSAAAAVAGGETSDRSAAAPAAAAAAPVKGGPCFFQALVSDVVGRHERLSAEDREAAEEESLLCTQLLERLAVVPMVAVWTPAPKPPAGAAAAGAAAESRSTAGSTAAAAAAAAPAALPAPQGQAAGAAGAEAGGDAAPKPLLLLGA